MPLGQGQDLDKERVGNWTLAWRHWCTQPWLSLAGRNSLLLPVRGKNPPRLEGMQCLHQKQVPPQMMLILKFPPNLYLGIPSYLSSEKCLSHEDLIDSLVPNHQPSSSQGPFADTTEYESHREIFFPCPSSMFTLYNSTKVFWEEP